MNKKRICIFGIIMFGLAAAGILYFAFRPNITCPDGTVPDDNGCCPGEVYTDMGQMGFNCCPQDEEGGDCFPPIK